MSFKRPIHLVLRSEMARGRWSFLDSRNRYKIERWLKHFAVKRGLRIYEQALVWNHLHLVVRFPDRASYNAFIRALTGTLPRSVFRFQDADASFWDHRPFTRIVEWGRDYKQACAYVQKNVLEALGLIRYEARTDWYGRWLQDRGAAFHSTA